MKGRRGPPEFSTEFHDILTSLFEVNFAATVIQKIFLKTPGDGALKIAINIANQCRHKLFSIREYFIKISAEISDSIVSWTKVASCYYEIILYWSLFAINQMMIDRTTEKTKNIEQIYLENNVIANKLFDLRDDAEKLKGSYGKDEFNVKECANLTLLFLDSHKTHLLKKYIYL